LKSFENVSSVT